MNSSWTDCGLEVCNRALVLVKWGRREHFSLSHHISLPPVMHNSNIWLSIPVLKTIKLRVNSGLACKQNGSLSLIFGGKKGAYSGPLIDCRPATADVQGAISALAGRPACPALFRRAVTVSASNHCLPRNSSSPLP